MNKRLIAIGLTLALGGLSTSAFAAHTGDPGQFYIGAGVGQAKWDIDNLDPDPGFQLDDTDTAATVRIGYVWHWDVDFAVEGGYADMGEFETSYKDNMETVHGSVKNHGIFAGVKVKYDFAQNWFVMARAGFYRNKLEAHTRDIYKNPYSSGKVNHNNYSNEKTGSDWYAGAGVGYSINRHFSLGLNYDYFNSEISDLSDNYDVSIGTVTVGAEYRF